MGFLRRSQSSFEFKSFLHVGKLRAVKEHEDELTLPYEPQGRRQWDQIFIKGEKSCSYVMLFEEKNILEKNSFGHKFYVFQILKMNMGPVLDQQ